MDELTAFMNARLAEDQAAAKACADLESAAWRPVDENVRSHDGGGSDVVVALERETAEHIARHDPGRALREVAAKRARLALMTEAHAEMDKLLADKHAGDVERAMAIGRARAATVAVKHDAAIWNGHADYRAEWAV